MIVVFSDVFGVDSAHHKRFCDELQDKLGDSTAVWMPDLFRGKPILPAGQQPRKSIVMDALRTLFYTPYMIWTLQVRITVPGIEQDLREMVFPQVPESCDYIGCVGFCFGGWTAARALGMEKFAAGACVHPGLFGEHFIKGGSGSVETLVRRTGNKPILLLPAKEDMDAKLDSKVVRLLAQRRALRPSDVCVEFPQMRHGWVSRGDSSDPAVQAAQNEALELVVNFFSKHFKLS